MAKDTPIELEIHGGAMRNDPGSPPEDESRGGSWTQQLDRFITLFPAVAFGLTLLSSWEAVGISFGAGLLNGGPTALAWGMLIASVGATTIALSLAEMASITPVVGAQYRWSGLYAPRFMTPAFWSLIQGWLTTFAWIAFLTATVYPCAAMTQGLIGLNNPTYIPERWHITLIMWAFLTLIIALNIYARTVLVGIELIGGVLHVVFFIATTVALAVMAPKSSASFVFTESFFGQSGWSNQSIQWFLGLLTSTAVLSGYDGALHMSGEMKNAPRNVPRSIVIGVIMNSILAFGFTLLLLFCIGDPMAALTTPTGYPVIEIYLQATGSATGATVLTCFIIIPETVCLFNVFASVTRLVWAFSRDNGLPFSSFFSVIHPTLHIPIRALGLVSVICALLGLISVGSTVAFFALLSLSTISLYLSYLIPIFFFLLRKLEGRHPSYGPFKLGRFGIPINTFAVCYCIFMIIWLPFPSMLPVTAKNFNYAGPIMAAVLIAALLDWFISGHKRFQVPTDPYRE